MPTNTRRPLLATLAVLTTLGCEPGSPLMEPGENCVTCHTRFTVAGTVFSATDALADGGLAGVVVTVTDATGAEVALTSNDAGNFYTNAKLALPLARATVTRDGRVTAMSGAPAGACNSCHTEPPDGGAAGRIYAP